MDFFELLLLPVFKIMLIELVIFWAARFVYQIIVNREFIGKYIKNNGFSLLGILKIISWSEVFLIGSGVHKKPLKQYVVAQAKVLKAENKSYTEYESEEKKVIYQYHLEVKFSVGDKTVTTMVFSDSYDRYDGDTVEICYDPSCPTNAYVADDKAMQGSSVIECIASTFATYMDIIRKLFAIAVLLFLVEMKLGGG